MDGKQRVQNCFSKVLYGVCVQSVVVFVRGGRVHCVPYLITSHPLSLCNPTCQAPFPGSLIPDWTAGKGNTKGTVSVYRRSLLNNKHINLMDVSTRRATGSWWMTQGSEALLEAW